MKDTIIIGGEVSLLQVIDGDCVLSEVLDGDPGTFMPIYPNPYTGAVKVTPAATAQELKTAGFFMPQNITIEPIPSNYGLITWNGSTLTVS